MMQTRIFWHMIRFRKALIKRAAKFAAELCYEPGEERILARVNLYEDWFQSFSSQNLRERFPEAADAFGCSEPWDFRGNEDRELLFFRTTLSDRIYHLATNSPIKRSPQECEFLQKLILDFCFMDIENRFPSVTFEVFADETDEVFADETETTDHSGQKFVEEKMLAARLLRELFDFLRPYLASRKEDEKFNFSNYVDFKDLLFGRLGVQTDPEDQSILQSTQHEALVNEDFFEWLQRWWKKNKNPDLDSCEEFLQRTFRLPSYEKEKD